MYDYVVKHEPVVLGSTSYRVGDVISGDAARELEQHENRLRIRNCVKRTAAAIEAQEAD